MKNKPNLFIIGAMKSGTSSLHDYLGKHPQVFMSQFKEPMYFSRGEDERMTKSEYESLFDKASDQIYLGESSTEYSKLPQRQNSANRIKSYAPNAKLIYIMREPFKRAISHYWHQVKMGREQRSMKDALTLDSEYLLLSYYAYQLQPYYDLFGAENIFLCSFETFVKNPDTTLNNICDWLEIDNPTESRSKNASKKNVTPEVLYLGSDSFINFIQTPVIRLLKKLIPRSYSFILRSLPKLSKRFVNKNSPIFKEEILTLYEELSPTLQKWNRELYELTKSDFAHWKSWQN